MLSRKLIKSLFISCQQIHQQRSHSISLKNARDVFVPGGKSGAPRTVTKNDDSGASIAGESQFPLDMLLVKRRNRDFCGLHSLRHDRVWIVVFLSVLVCLMFHKKKQTQSTYIVPKFQKKKRRKCKKSKSLWKIWMILSLISPIHRTCLFKGEGDLALV